MEYPGHHTSEIVPTQLARQPRDQIPIAHLGLREEEEGGLPLLRHPATPVRHSQYYNQSDKFKQLSYYVTSVADQDL